MHLSDNQFADIIEPLIWGDIMKKILMFGMSSYPGGIENYIKNYFCNHQFAEHFKIDFITYEDKLAYQNDIAFCGHDVLKVPHLKRKPMQYYQAVKKIMAEGQYDYIYVNMLSCANCIPIFLAVQNHVKNIVLHAHASGTVGALRNILHRLFKKYCCRHASVRLACGNKAGEWVFGKQDCIIIPNAIDASRFLFDDATRQNIRKKLNVSEDEIVLGHVGRFAPEKNHLFLLETFDAWLRQGNDSSKLLLIGDGGAKQQIVQHVKQKGLQDRVIFYGSTQDTAKLYTAFDYFLFPSTFEGFGMSVLEAQASGRRCLVADTLPKAVDVTGNVQFLPIDKGVTPWITALENSADPIDPIQMNKAVAESKYNISKQVARLVKLLDG